MEISVSSTTTSARSDILSKLMLASEKIKDNESADIAEVLTWASEEMANFAKWLTMSEVSTIVYDLFLRACPMAAIHSLISSLSSNSAHYHHFVILSKIVTRHYIEPVLVRSLLVHPADVIWGYKFRSLAQELISFKDRLSNVRNRLSLTDKEYREAVDNCEEALIEGVKTALLKAYSSVVDGSSEMVNLTSIALLVTKGSSLCLECDPATTLLISIFYWFCGQPVNDVIWDRLARRVFADSTIGCKELEYVITRIVFASQSPAHLQRCLGSSVKDNVVIRRVCTRRLLLQKVCSSKVPSILGEFLMECGGQELFQDTYGMILSVWSDVSSMRQNTVEQEKYFARVIIIFNKIMRDKVDGHRVDSYIPIVMKGTQLRLGNEDTIIRQSGMMVGEVCSNPMMSTVEALKFDYIEDDWYKTLKRLADGIKEEQCEQSSALDVQSIKQPLLPTAELVTEIDSDDEELPAYRIPDSETKLKKMAINEEVPKEIVIPTYLRDCLDALGEKEKYEIFEGALTAIAPLVSRNAIGLKEIGYQLISKLILLDNRFGMERFEEIRKEAMIEIICALPFLARIVVDMIYSRDCPMYNRVVMHLVWQEYAQVLFEDLMLRYLILECLMKSARQLAGRDVTAEAESLSDGVSVDDTVASDWRATVAARVINKTRYFSSRKGEPLKTAKPTTNRLGPVLSEFVYPLLQSKTGEHLQLKGSDSSLLGRVLFTVGEILQCAVNTPQIVIVAMKVADEISSLRFHDDNHVRAGVMYCYYSIIQAVPQQVLREVGGSRLSEWLQWTDGIQSSVDESQHDRLMAAHLLKACLLTVDES